jgi:phospholipase D-like protein
MGDTKRWSDLSTGQRRAIIGAGTAQISLLVAALVDIRRRPAREIRGSKRLWTAASFVNFLGPIAYFVAGRRR